MSWNQDIAIDPVPGVPAGQPGGPNNPDGKEHHEAWEWLAYACRDADQASKKVDKLATQMQALAEPAAPTDAQVDAAILKAMLDPAVQKGIADGIAAHLHVS